MDVAAVMSEFGDRLGTIPDLRVFDSPPGSVTPPAAVVGYPTRYEFDETYGRGMDTMTIPVVVVVGRPTDRPTRDALSRYVSGSGPYSVKAALESGSHLACHMTRVTAVDFDAYTIGGTDYLAAIFDVDVAGPGA